jgi:hypothetical protein
MRWPADEPQGCCCGRSDRGGIPAAAVGDRPGSHCDGETGPGRATRTTNEAQPSSKPLDRVFRVTASECSLDRVRRWRDEGTLLRAYLSHDGALVLADPVLGGNAACEPATVTRQAPKRVTSQDRSAPEGG